MNTCKVDTAIFTFNLWANICDTLLCGQKQKPIRYVLVSAEYKTAHTHKYKKHTLYLKKSNTWLHLSVNKMNCFCLHDYFTSSLRNLSRCLWHTAISFSLTCVSVPHKYFGLPTAQRHISASVNETVMTKSSLMRFTSWLTSLFSLSAIPLIITTQAADLKVFLDWNRAGWTSPCSKLVSLQQLLFTSPVGFQLDLVIWTSQAEHEHLCSILRPLLCETPEMTWELFRIVLVAVFGEEFENAHSQESQPLPLLFQNPSTSLEPWRVDLTHFAILCY